jgi:L-iditol 2-dehydrogenase
VIDSTRETRWWCNEFLYVVEQDVDKEVTALQEAMGGRIDVTCDCAGLTKTMTTALKATRSGGNISLIGMGHHEMTVPLTPAAAR